LKNITFTINKNRKAFTTTQS